MREIIRRRIEDLANVGGVLVYFGSDITPWTDSFDTIANRIDNELYYDKCLEELCVSGARILGNKSGAVTYFNSVSRHLDRAAITIGLKFKTVGAVSPKSS